MSHTSILISCRLLQHWKTKQSKTKPKTTIQTTTNNKLISFLKHKNLGFQLPLKHGGDILKLQTLDILNRVCAYDATHLSQCKKLFLVLCCSGSFTLILGRQVRVCYDEPVDQGIA